MQDLLVYIDVDLYNVPCEIVDLRFISRKGRDHQITREHLTATGLQPFSEDRDTKDVISAFDRKEGCKIKGSFYKHFVMNNFVITLGNPQILSRIIMERPGKVFDLSHGINEFLLGDFNSRHYYIEYLVIYDRNYKVDGFNKLQGTKVQENRPEDNPNLLYRHTYFVTAIPTVFDNYFGTTEIFQYTTSEYSKPGPESAIVFM